jgi:hypothetical protein
MVSKETLNLAQHKLFLGVSHYMSHPATLDIVQKLAQ